MVATTVTAFRSRFRGELIAPGDPTYDLARSVWNGDINRHPALVARCSTADDVASAVTLARQQDLEVSVRGGGHSFAGFAVADEAVMIDLSRMREVNVDPIARRVVAGGGATWHDLDKATQAHGLAVTGGYISHTGIGGLTLGGGIGWLTRKAGLSSDNLARIELVTADGRRVYASADEQPDLFWAIRGGGGNFGVVTAFDYTLVEVGPLVNLGMFFWNTADGEEALRVCRDFIPTLPADAGVLLAGLVAPPSIFVPEDPGVAPGYALMVAGFGTAAEHDAMIGPIRDLLPPVYELVLQVPYVQLQQMFDAGNPWGILAYQKSLYMDVLSDGAIAVIAEHLPRRVSPNSFVPIFALGGAYGRLGEADSAFGGSRSAGIVVNIEAVCATRDAFERDRQWVRAFWDALLPYSSGIGSYVNFMAEYEEDRVRAAYGAAKYERLARIKSVYDHDNVFHFNANIRPAG